MSKRRCELCSNTARMFCESDQASLCWDCDEMVHAANFLVVKHSRTLLCHVCHSPTPWKAAGPKLGPTFSVCHGCTNGDAQNRGGAASSSRREDDDEYGGYDSPESESDDAEYYSDSEGFSEEEEEEDGENQVVPWSDSGLDSPPAAVTAESYPGSHENFSLPSSKRTRENAFESEDEDWRCSSENLDLKFQDSDENCSSSLSLLRPLKMRWRSNGGGSEQASEVDAPSSSRGQPPSWRNFEDFSRKL